MTGQELLDKAVMLFSAGRFAEAEMVLWAAGRLEPDGLWREYLVAVWTTQFVPGNTTKENLDWLVQAERMLLEIIADRPEDSLLKQRLAAIEYLRTAEPIVW